MRQPILEATDQEIGVTRNVDYSPQEPLTEPISLPKSQRRNVREIQNLLKQCAGGKSIPKLSTNSLRRNQTAIFLSQSNKAKITKESE